MLIGVKIALMTRISIEAQLVQQVGCKAMGVFHVRSLHVHWIARLHDAISARPFEHRADFLHASRSNAWPIISPGLSTQHNLA